MAHSHEPCDEFAEQPSLFSPLHDIGKVGVPDAILRNLVACHHEVLDGSGDPRGLRGNEIPIEARIVTVSDIFDALSSRRVYGERWSLDATFERLDEMVGDGRIDGDCVAVLSGHRDEVVEIMRRFAEE